MQLGNRGWSLQYVLPVFKNMERYDGGSDELRDRERLASPTRHVTKCRCWRN